MAIDLILGTAGHIDHGKTALVRALTGVETDRLPEEKKRGITIELGFASLELGDEYRLGIVDVPGHERFVRQMLAGATGMDLAMLVVAADDSVKPQTREHVEVLRMLDIPAGVIVLTKCDLADEDWTELVESEVRELVAGSFLADAPVIRTSAVTGSGIDELKAALTTAAGAAAQKIGVVARESTSESPDQTGDASEMLAAESTINALLDVPFRLPIDRTFTMTGHGTVVTGSVVSGRASVGDELTIQPGNVSVRIRGIQNHDQTVESVSRGQRAAINVAGIHHEEIHRGHELTAVGHLIESQLITASIHLLKSAVRPLKNRAHVRVHVGTAEILATVSLLNASKVEPGDAAVAQLFLREPVATSWRQPFVLRSESPVETIGGGHVLVPVADKIKKATSQELSCLEELLSDQPTVRASAALYFHGLRSWQDTDLARLAGVTDAAATAEQLREQKMIVPLKVSPTRTARLERRALNEWVEKISSVLERAHENDKLKIYVDRSVIHARFKYLDDKQLIDAVIAWMHRQKIVRQTELGVALASHAPKLSKKQQRVLDEIVDGFRLTRFQPPSIAECNKMLPGEEKEVARLLKLAVAEGRLIHVGQKIHLHFQNVEEMKVKLRDALNASDGMTLSEIRELLGTTRKYAVPIAEYLDRIGFTRRKGDVRVLG